VSQSFHAAIQDCQRLTRFAVKMHNVTKRYLRLVALRRPWPDGFVSLSIPSSSIPKQRQREPHP
jgi:hypothetical protein